ncbi:MAG: 30S ribosomal protein S6 [Clostridia bacterium]|nr:30S ribosomal protein S6 [Clostridia bacterium]
MNKYETVIILGKNLNEKEIDEVNNKLVDVIKQDGKVEQIEKLGLKKLAYEIRKQKEAYYVVLTYKTIPDTIRELERVMRITDEILKFITVRRDD